MKKLLLIMIAFLISACEPHHQVVHKHHSHSVQILHNAADQYVYIFYEDSRPRSYSISPVRTSDYSSLRVSPISPSASGSTVALGSRNLDNTEQNVEKFPEELEKATEQIENVEQLELAENQITEQLEFDFSSDEVVETSTDTNSDNGSYTESTSDTSGGGDSGGGDSGGGDSGGGSD